MSQRLPSIRQHVVDESRREAKGGYGAWVRLAKKVASLADREVKQCQADAGFAYQAACSPGCDACCTRLVEATLPDVMAALDFIDSTWSDEEVDEFLTRAAEADQANRPLWNDEIDRPLAPCAFLKEGLCSVYPARPASCRAMNCDSAEACHRYFRNGEAVGMPIEPEQFEVTTLGKAVVVGMAQAGAPSGTYEFAAAVRLFLESPELTEDLSKPNSGVERLKLFSEASRPEEEPSPPIARLRQTAEGQKLLEYLHAPEPVEFHRQLDKFKGSPAEAIYRMWLPLMYSDKAQADECWSQLESALARFEDYEGSPSEIFDMVQGFNVFTWAYSDRDALPITRRFMDRLHHWAGLAHPGLQDPLPNRKPGKFRLGFVSGRMTNFNGSRWALGVLQHPHPDIETTVFNLAAMEDSTSYSFRRSADHYFHLPLQAADVARKIRGADLDALVFTDIGMDGRSMQLASFRLARRQYTAWGHPVSSGAPEIDAYLSSEYMEPDGAEAHYRERLVALPKNGLSTPYRPAQVSEKSATELGLPTEGFLLYAQYFQKLHPRFDPMFRQLAEESKVPIVFMGARTLAMFDQLTNRLGGPNVIVMGEIPRPDYLRAMQLADASLESPSFGGGFTALDALMVGTPIVTLPGRFMRQRLSVGYLETAGIHDLAVTDESQYVSLATDRHRLAASRSAIDSSSLFSNQAAIDALYAELLS